MGVTFTKKAKPPTGKAQKEDTEKSSETSKPKAAFKKQKPSSGASWMKTGAAAKKALVEEEARAEKNKAEQGKLWRYWMPEDSDRKITFLDGDLDDEGMLDIPMFHEHFVKVNGSSENYVCTMEQEGFCPLCNTGDSKPALVGIMTVVDHTPYKVKTGANAGKVYKDRKKLFVAKKQTVRMLSKLAVKRDGLRGCTFDVSRTGDKSAGVGNQFDFDCKSTVAELMAAYSIEADALEPADYDAEVTYRTSEELADLGLGAGPSGPGFENSGVTKKNLDDEL